MYCSSQDHILGSSQLPVIPVPRGMPLFYLGTWMHMYISTNVHTHTVKIWLLKHMGTNVWKNWRTFKNQLMPYYSHFFKKLILYSYIFVYEYMPVYTMCDGCFWRPEEIVGSSGAAGTCGLSDMDAGNWTLVLCKSSKCLQLLSPLYWFLRQGSLVWCRLPM